MNMTEWQVLSEYCKVYLISYVCPALLVNLGEHSLRCITQVRLVRRYQYMYSSLFVNIGNLIMFVLTRQSSAPTSMSLV